MIEDAGFYRVKYHNFTGGVVALHSGFKLWDRPLKANKQKDLSVCFRRLLPVWQINWVTERRELLCWCHCTLVSGSIYYSLWTTLLTAASDTTGESGQTSSVQLVLNIFFVTSTFWKWIIKPVKPTKADLSVWPTKQPSSSVCVLQCNGKQNSTTWVTWIKLYILQIFVHF